MPSNLDRYKKDLASLLAKGLMLEIAIKAECFPENFKSAKAKETLKTVPSFRGTYQSWYSEALVLVKQLLPDRLLDFTSLYLRPKSRKELSYENYRIEDYLQGLSATRMQGYEKVKVVGPDAAIPHFYQQMAIVRSVEARFESSLFEIRQMVQGDLFDSELDAAKELANNRFARAAGALAGVVLERHLSQVCSNHNINLNKKSPTISDLNDALKEAGAIEVPQWRFVQHLADIRNICDHNKKQEPTADQVEDLLDGVSKITKTMF